MSNQYQSVPPETFTHALALAATAVTVVTTDGKGGQAGLTVSSMCSVCAEPPVVLVCVASENQFCKAVQENNSLVVNLLSTEQTEIAKVFAGLSADLDEQRFNTGNWGVLSTGSPVLDNALASLDCQVSTQYVHGTHTIYICRVVDLTSSNRHPLVYSGRQFCKTATL